jgi:radical SAM superfamily enzyme YgiQ (UPF0313 family)
MRQQRSIENIIKEIRYLVDEVGIRKILFTDNEFFASGRAGKKRSIELAKAIFKNKLDIQFHIMARANNVDYECFRLLRRAGLVKVFVGFESFIQRTLDLLQKDITVEQNIRAIKILRELGIEFGMGLIIADPYTTIGEIKVTLKYLKQYDLMAKAISHQNLSNALIVYPGTPIHQKLEYAGKLKGSTRFGGLYYDFEDPRIPIFLKAAQHVSNIWSFLYGVDMINIQYQPNGENKKKRIVQEANRDFIPKGVGFLEQTLDILLQCSDINIAKQQVEEFKRNFNLVPKM